MTAALSDELLKVLVDAVLVEAFRSRPCDCGDDGLEVDECSLFPKLRALLEVQE